MTIWISKKLVMAIHDEQLRAHGGASGVRDDGLLESALARPVNRAAYGDADVVELAGLYAMAIAKNHPYLDGNKRTAFSAMVTCLALNGLNFEPTEAQAVLMMLRMAAGESDEADFIAGVREHVSQREQP